MHHGRIEMIREERTARAALLPSRPQHEVIDNQLVSPVKKLSQCLFSLWPLERVLLFHLLPGQLAPLPAQLVSQLRELFLFLQQLISRGKPLILRYQLRGTRPAARRARHVGLSLYSSLWAQWCSHAVGTAFPIFCGRAASLQSIPSPLLISPRL